MGMFEGGLQLSSSKHHAQSNYSSTLNSLDDVELGQGPKPSPQALSIVTLPITSSLSFPSNWLEMWMAQDNFFLLLKAVSLCQWVRLAG